MRWATFSKLHGTTYDDDFTMGNVSGVVMLEDKYSEFVMGNFKTGKLEFHDSDFKAGNAEGIEIKSKYSKFNLERVDNISFESSHDDDLKIMEIGSLDANSKYSSYQIKQLKKSVILAPTHDDDLEIDALDANFNRIEVDGKYTNVKAHMNANTQFHLEVEMNYGKVEFDEGNFETQIWKEKSASKEIKGKTKGATEKSGTLLIKGHDNSVSLR